MSAFEQKRLRRAEFITPPNNLKQKTGHGGLADDVLNRAQQILENSTVDFEPVAETFLKEMRVAITIAQDNNGNIPSEEIILSMMYPAIEMRANGTMFKYPVVSKIADILINFLEVIERPDKDAIEIVSGFHTAIRTMIAAKIQTEGHEQAKPLIKALLRACEKYFEKKRKS